MEKIRKLIRAGKLEKAIDELIGLVGDKDEELPIVLTQHRAALSENKKKHRIGFEHLRHGGSRLRIRPLAQTR